MVSLRCRMQVRDELRKLGYNLVVFEMGTVELLEDIIQENREQFGKKIKRAGMLLLDEKSSEWMDKAQIIIKKSIAGSESSTPLDILNILAEKMDLPVKEIKELFPEIMGISLNQYIMNCKIDQVKEILLYEDFTLDQIANNLHFTNRANLSYQFKKVTGLSPSYYKLIKEKRRINKIMLEKKLIK